MSIDKFIERNNDRYNSYIDYLKKTGADPKIIELPVIKNLIMEVIQKGDKRNVFEGRSPIYYKDANEDGTFDICGRTSGYSVNLIYKINYCSNDSEDNFLLLKKYELVEEEQIMKESQIIINKEGNISNSGVSNIYNIGYGHDALFTILDNLSKNENYYTKGGNNMEKITISYGDDLETVVKKLLMVRERGEHMQYVFTGHSGPHLLDSDTVSMDSAFLEIVGCTKEELDRSKKEILKEYRNELEKSKQNKQECEELFEKKKDVSSKEITLEKVVNGLKFIAEHQSISQEELINRLLELGCSFTFDDIKEQFPGEMGTASGIKEGNLACAASIIVNIRQSEVSRSIITENFLLDDNDSSIYNFIRVSTNDDTYTKENVDKLNKKNSLKFTNN